MAKKLNKDGLPTDVPSAVVALSPVRRKTHLNRTSTRAVAVS